METTRYILLVNGLLAIVTIAYYVLLRRETFFHANRLALWLGLICAVVLPLVELPAWWPQPGSSVMQRTVQGIEPDIVLANPFFQPDVTITFPDMKTYKAFQERQQRFGWMWIMACVALYALMTFSLLLRFAIRLFSLQKLIRKSEQEPYTDFMLVQSADILSPFSFFGWVFVNPGRHTPDELDQILRHERVHVRERHSIDMLAAELVCIAFWFNPAAYLFRRLLQQTLEFSADRAVLAEGVDAKLYQYNLLKVSLSGGQSTITSHFSSSPLKSRIIMLNRSASTRVNWLKCPVLLLAALAVASAFTQPQAEKSAKPMLAIVPMAKKSSKTLMPSITEIAAKLTPQGCGHPGVQFSYEQTFGDNVFTFLP